MAFDKHGGKVRVQRLVGKKSGVHSQHFWKKISTLGGADLEYLRRHHKKVYDKVISYIHEKDKGKMLSKVFARADNASPKDSPVGDEILWKNKTYKIKKKISMQQAGEYRFEVEGHKGIEYLTFDDDDNNKIKRLKGK